MLHISTVDTTTLELLKKLLNINDFEGLQLVGGTALALQLGHRKSIDLDLFGKINFEDLDTAAMKLAAITGRGSKKDFVDIFFLLQKYSLHKMIDFYNKKYYDGSEYLVIKSLTYFDDAEKDNGLEMLVDI